jgi:hypothetical protein
MRISVGYICMCAVGFFLGAAGGYLLASKQAGRVLAGNHQFSQVVAAIELISAYDMVQDSKSIPEATQRLEELVKIRAKRISPEALLYYERNFRGTASESQLSRLQEFPWARAESVGKMSEEHVK